MSVLTFEEYPTNFSSTEDFVEALNSYEGDNIWQELIYGAEIDGAEIDEERSNNADGTIVYLKSGKTIVYYEAEKAWR